MATSDYSENVNNYLNASEEDIIAYLQTLWQLANHSEPSQPAKKLVLYAEYTYKGQDKKGTEYGLFTNIQNSKGDRLKYPFGLGKICIWVAHNPSYLESHLWKIKVGLARPEYRKKNPFNLTLLGKPKAIIMPQPSNLSTSADIKTEDIFSKEDKQVVYSLLIQVMKADAKETPEEKDFLAKIRERLALTTSDTEKANSFTLEECKSHVLLFNEEQRHQMSTLLEQMAFADGIYVDQERNIIQALGLNLSHHRLNLISSWRGENPTIIGLFTKKEDGRYCFEDICSLGFTPLRYKDKKDIEILIEGNDNLLENCYYTFEWALEIDNSPRGFRLIPKNNKFSRIEPRDLVDTLYNNWLRSGIDIIAQAQDFQNTINTQLTASSQGTFIYELLQNANDYPQKINGHAVPVDVEFHITQNYLIFRHTGMQFSPRNIAAISKTAAGEKKKEKNAIGYKGIGFKTVFSENNYVYLQSGDYTLRFDESFITHISPDLPWHIIPIWTSEPDFNDDDVKTILTSAPNFNVQMVIRPNRHSKLREDEDSYVSLFNELFKDEKDILFIPNIHSVRVFYDGKEQIVRTKNQDNWSLTTEPLVYKFSQEEIEENNREVVSNKRIPEKYKDFDDTRVSFACQRKGSTLMPVDKARIYCYLPTQVSMGFPFMMNTDMIPTGPRDDVEKQIKFNHKLMKIAGGKLVQWLNNLISCNEYDLESVFTLIPTFEEVENYEQFIEEFEEGFKDALETIEFIPTEDGQYKLLHNIVRDKTGLSSLGIFTDDEFLRIVGKEDFCLPCVALRDNADFNRFLEKYSSEEITQKDFLYKAYNNSEILIDWFKSADDEKRNKFYEWLQQCDEVYKDDVSDIVNFLPLFEVNGEFFSMNQIMESDDLLVLTSIEFEPARDALTTLGFLCTTTLLAEGVTPMYDFILKPTGTYYFEKIVRKIDDNANLLESRQKQALFLALRSLEDIGSVKLSKIALFSNKNNTITPLCEMFNSTQKHREWLNPYILKSNEYFPDLDECLIQEDDVFDKVIWEHREDSGMTLPEFYEAYRWTDSKYTQRLLYLYQRDLEQYKQLIKIVEVSDSDIQKEYLSKYTYKNSIILSANEHYDNDSFIYRLLKLASGVLNEEELSSFSDKIFFEDRHIRNYTLNDEVECRFTQNGFERKITMSLNKILPNVTEKLSSDRIVSLFENQDVIRRFINSSSMPLEGIVNELSAILGVTNGFWPTDRGGNALQYLFYVYYYRECMRYTSGRVLYINLENESDGFVFELMDFLYSNQIKISDSPFTYRLEKYFSGKFLSSSFVLPSETILTSIQKWADNDDKRNYLLSNGVKELDEKSYKLRKLFCDNIAINIDEIEPSIEQIRGFLSYVSEAEQLELPITGDCQRQILAELYKIVHDKISKDMFIRPTVGILKIKSKECDTPEYREWRLSNNITIYLYPGKLLHSLCYKGKVMAFIEIYDYAKFQNDIFINEQADFEQIISDLVRKEVLTFEDYDALCRQGKVLVEQGYVEQVEQEKKDLEQDKKTLEEENERLKKRIEELEKKKQTPLFNQKETAPDSTPTNERPNSNTIRDNRTIGGSQQSSEGNQHPIQKDTTAIDISNPNDSDLSGIEQWAAQCEAQQCLKVIKDNYWIFPDGFGEKDDEGRPLINSTFKVTIDSCGTIWYIVLKSHKNEDEPLKINTFEWESIINLEHPAHLFIYVGNGDIKEIEPRELIMNQPKISISFSTENLDIEERIQAFTDSLRYFKELHFDFESFDLARRGQSIKDIYNTTEGRQSQTGDDDI